MIIFNFKFRDMKKQVLMMAALALALGGCSKTETTGSAQGGTIGFAGSGVNNITKAGDLTDENFTKFYVYGGYGTGANQSVFDGEEVTGTISGDWSYTNTRYWAVGNWKFGAYSTNAPEGGVTPDWNYGTELTLEVNSDNSHQGDLVYAEATRNVTDVTSPGGDVSLNFKHLLSKIQFKFTKADDLMGQKVELSDFKVTGITTSGTWIGGEKQNENSPTTSDYTIWNGTPTEINSTNGLTTGAFYVIPQSVETFTIEVTAKVTQGEEVIRNGKVTATLPKDVYTQWEEQKAYQYSASIAWKNIDDEDPETPETEPIVFDVTELNSWKNAEPVEDNITSELEDATL